VFRSQSYHAHSSFACYRYVILVWRNGSKRLQHRQPQAVDVGQLLTWHQRCLKIQACLEQSNMMSMLLASYCGNCSRDRSHLTLVNFMFLHRTVARILTLGVKIWGGDRRGPKGRSPMPERPRAWVRFLERGSQLPPHHYGIWGAL